jgi:hypothetical protein
MHRRFYDLYGCSATIIRKRNQTYDLTIRMHDGTLLYKHNYTTYRGARIGMSKWSDCWEKAIP